MSLNLYNLPNSISILSHSSKIKNFRFLKSKYPLLTKSNNLPGVPTIIYFIIILHLEHLSSINFFINLYQLLHKIHHCLYLTYISLVFQILYKSNELILQYDIKLKQKQNLGFFIVFTIQKLQRLLFFPCQIQLNKVSHFPKLHLEYIIIILQMDAQKLHQLQIDLFLVKAKNL